jgi:hypothetical protein
MSDMARGVPWWKWEDWYIMVSRDDEHIIWPPRECIAVDMSSSERVRVLWCGMSMRAHMKDKDTL